MGSQKPGGPRRAIGLLGLVQALTGDAAGLDHPLHALQGHPGQGQVRFGLGQSGLQLAAASSQPGSVEARQQRPRSHWVAFVHQHCVDHPG